MIKEAGVPITEGHLFHQPLHLLISSYRLMTPLMSGYHCSHCAGLRGDRLHGHFVTHTSVNVVRTLSLLPISFVWLNRAEQTRAI